VYGRWFGFGWIESADFISGKSNEFRKEADFDWKGLKAK
jgi:hypothetical protein